MKKLTYSLLSLLLILPAVAQEPADDIEEQEIRRYTVEIIVFKYAEDVSSGSEVFLGDKIEFDEDELEILALRPFRSVGDFKPLPDIEFVLLEEEDYQLTEALGRLQRLDAYEPIMHFGWTQATWPEEQTEPLSLYRFATPPADLHGSLTLYLSRYLHLVVDLQLDNPVASPLDYSTIQPQRGPVRYVINENRILKNGELRYYDHPKFGVLAKVTRVEEEEEEDPEESELLGYGPE
jgi:hypothetical protein